MRLIFEFIAPCSISESRRRPKPLFKESRLVLPQQFPRRLMDLKRAFTIFVVGDRLTFPFDKASMMGTEMQCNH